MGIYVSSPLEPSQPSHLGGMGSELRSHPSQRGNTIRHELHGTFHENSAEPVRPRGTLCTDGSYIKLEIFLALTPLDLVCY